MSFILNTNAMRRILCASATALLAHTAFAQSAGTIVYTYQYDNNDNLLQATDALGHVTHQSYDALNRRTSQLDPNNGLTQYGYDPLDHLISVTDPRHLVTGYQIDGLGNLNQQSSPDTGTTVNTYDKDGNLLTQTDAKGQTTHYAYDALNRVTAITYADNSQVTYTYDQGPNGLGHLTQISDAGGSIHYAYDAGDRLLTDTRIVNIIAAIGSATTPTTFITSYSYDNVGRLAGIVYPSGLTLAYTRDGLGRISQIAATKGSASTVILSQVVYRPFGGIQSYVNSAGKTVARSYDLSGRITSYTLNSQLHSLAYDGASNIINATDAVTPANNASYSYDPLARLTSALTASTSLSYAYDPNGNRTSASNGSAQTNDSYAAASNRLTQISGAQAATIVTDPNGSITGNSNNQFTYDARGRLIAAVTLSGPVHYTVNPLGQRSQKITAATGTVYQYDSNGKLIGETSGNAGKDYVYLGDMPVAVIPH